MDLPINEFFEVFEQLCRNRQLKVAAINSIKGGIITGLAAFVGGLMVGPAGLAIGGALGGLGSAIAGRQNHESVIMIIKKMPNEEKRELYRRVKRACEKISVPQMIFIATLLTNMRYQDLSISEVSQFLQDHYSLRIV